MPSDPLYSSGAWPRPESPPALTFEQVYPGLTEIQDWRLRQKSRPTPVGGFREMGTPEFTTVSASALLTHAFPPRSLMLQPWLPERGLAMVYGPRGIGKTHLSLGVAYALATGGTFLRWTAPKPRRVLVLDGEMPAVALQDRLRAILPPGAEPPPNMRFLTMDLQDHSLDLSDPDCQAMLEQAIGDAECVIVDNISTLVAGGRENEAESWFPVQQWALHQRRSERSIVFIHHAGKGGQQRGTSRREDVLDSVVALRRPSDHEPGQGARFEVHFEKARGFQGADADPFEASLSPSGWTTRLLTDVEQGRVAALMAEGLSTRAIAEELGMSKSGAARAVKAIRDK